MRYSVIVPLYNAESTIKACIDSVLNQTYKDFELIIVDDGSTDKGGEICDAYALENDKIKVIHKQNGGAGKARNIGISLSKGEYILFLDADDEWESSLLKSLEEYSSDVITFGYKIDYGQKIVTKKIINESEELNVLNAVRILENQGAFNVVWNKAYKREILKSSSFPQENSCEDLIYNCRIFKNVKTVAILSSILYVYNRKEDITLANRYDKNLNENILKAKEERLSLYKEIGFVGEEAEKLFALKYIGYEFSKIPNIFRKNNGLKAKEKFKELKKIIKNKESKKYFKKVKVQGFYKKLLKFHVLTKTAVLAYINFSFMFFIRNNMTGLYKKFRRK